MVVNNREDYEESDVSWNEKMANNQNSEPNQRHCKAGPSQLTIEEASPSKTGEAGLESVSPVQTDLTGSELAVEEALPSKTREDGLESAPPVQTDLISSQFADEDESSSEIGEDDQEWAYPVRTDLTGFLERMIEDAKQAGVYDSMDGYGDADTQSTTDGPVQSKDERHLSDTDVFTGSTPGHIRDSTDEAPQSSCRDSSSKEPPISRIPLSQPATPKGFDDLCSLISKATIQRSTQKVAMRFNMSKAYKTGLTIGPSCHYDLLAANKAGMERRLPTGGKRKRDDIGFNPNEVMKKGALYSDNMDAKSSLTADIHPIFDEKHWTDCPEHIYNIIKPSLLLASKLLATPQCLQHFVTVLRGKREYCFDTSFRMGKACYRIKEDVPLTSESVLDLKSHFDSIAGSITFQFLDAFNIPKHANKFFATAKMVPCRHSPCSISTTQELDNRQVASISLHTDFYFQAQKLCLLQHPDPAQVLRFHFFLTMSLMHEFAHSFEFACSPVEAGKGMEVFMYDWLEAESGRAWEKSLFGDMVTVLNSRVDGLHGICVREWPDPELKDPERKGQAYNWTVPMSFVDSLFQESTWTGIQSKSIGEKDLLVIPKTGALSCGLITFSTAKFEEVLEERELGCLELALREVGGVPLIDEEDTEAEERRKRIKREKRYIPEAWLKQMGRTPFDKHFD